MLQLENRQQFFDSCVGLVLEKQCAFVDTVPDHCSNWEWEESGDLLLLNFPHLGTYEYQRLGTEFYESNTWKFAGSEDSISAAHCRASAAFRDHFKKNHDLLLSLPSLELSKANGDYLCVIASQLLNASAYFAWPDRGQNSLSFYLIFNLPLVECKPTPLIRIDTILGMLANSSQIVDKQLAISKYLHANGFQSQITDTASGHIEKFTDQAGRCITYEYSGHDSRTGKKVLSVKRTVKLSREDSPAKAVLATASELHFDTHCNYFVRAPLIRVADFG
jgi:hypothetical protein